MDFKGFVKGFDAWEHAAAQYAEQVFRSPFLLNPLGAGMTALFKAKADTDKALSTFWSALGLPTRTGEERTLHALNELQSRMFDLEERLVQLCAAQSVQVSNAQSRTAESRAPKQPTTATVARDRPKRRARSRAAAPSTEAKPPGKTRPKSTPSKLATAEAGPADLFSAPPLPPPTPNEKRPRSRKKSTAPQPPNG